MKRGMLICLSGIDGSGKTTIAKIFASATKGRDEFYYVWGHMQPEFDRRAKKLLHLFNRTTNDVRQIRQKLKATRHPLWKIYNNCLWIDYVRHITWNVTRPLFRGKNIIADRYVFDVAVQMGATLNVQRAGILKSVDNLLRLLPSPDVVFLLDVPVEIAFLRKNDIPSLEYLRVRQELYYQLAEQYSMFRLDGTSAPALIIGDIIRKLNRGVNS